jgi:glycosyltransferase involved in cell wall biosynthesis
VNLLRGKKILSIYYKHKPGGFCKRFYMMLKALADAGGEVHYIAVEPYPISHPRIVPHILWVPFSKREGLLFWIYFILTVPFYSLLIGLRSKIDIVSVFGGLYSFLAFPLKLGGTPIITFARSDVREINRLQRRSPLLMFFEDILVGIGFKRSDRVITVSDFLRETLSTRYRIHSKKIGVLKNHITYAPTDALTREACRRRLGFGTGNFIVVTLAVLNPEKNIEVLIRAGGALEMPATILIVGEGPERLKLERVASQAAGSTRVIFAGWQDPVSDYLSAADLCVFPSRYEGCSNALLEALAHGVACLGSRIPQNREVLCSESLLFDPDDPEELAKKISRISTDGGYLEEVRTLSEQSAKPFLFDWDDAVVVLHQEVLSLSNDRAGVGATSVG